MAHNQHGHHPHGHHPQAQHPHLHQQVHLLPVVHHQQAHQVPPPPIRELLLPHRFSLWDSTWNTIVTSNLTEKDRPFAFAPFPIARPAVLRMNDLQHGTVHGTLPPQLKFHRITKQPIATSPDSHTTIAPSVQNLHITHKLHSVRVSDELWTALAGFAVGPGPIQVRGQNAPIHNNHFNTFRVPPVLGLPLEPLPTRREQMRPVTALWGWFLMHLMTRNPLVNCEYAVQDEIHRQLLYPMDLLMMVSTVVI